MNVHQPITLLPAEEAAKLRSSGPLPAKPYKESVGLKQVATEVVAGMIFINFDPAPRETLREFLGPVAESLEQLPVAKAVDFTEWTYEIAANWKTNFDNFQENYHLRFIHPASYGATAGPDNPFGYASHYGFSGPHRTQKFRMNPNPPPPAPILVQGFSSGRALADQDGLSFTKTDFKLFPCLHVVGLPPLQQFTQTMFPLGPKHTRSVVRVYWPREADSATRLFYEEVAAHTLRDVLTEDRQTVEAAQRGLSSGALDVIHLQDHEILLRHSYEEVEARVQAYIAENPGTGATA